MSVSVFLGFWGWYNTDFGVFFRGALDFGVWFSVFVVCGELRDLLISAVLGEISVFWVFLVYFGNFGGFFVFLGCFCGISWCLGLV